MPLKTLSPLPAWFGYMRISLFERGHRPPWTAEIDAVLADLKDLNRSTEEDFLAIGGKLMTFLSDSRQLHDGIVSLTGLGSGEQAELACDALGSVRLFVGDMLGRCENGGRTLLVLQAGADRIRRGFSSFGKIVLSFRMAAIAARIEVAHLASSQQNLENLADDVTSCSDGIRERVARILAVAADFDSRIAETLREVSSFEAIQMRELPSLLAAVDADVCLFQTRRQKTTEGSLKLAAELDSVARELGAVATSIQFHDITRQQIEHVIDALQAVIGKARKGPISSADASMVRLQKRQLESAAASFGRSTAKINRDLETITARVTEMAASGNRVDCSGDGEQDTFLDGMRRRFAAIARAVAELHSLELGTRTVVADLRETSRGLGSAVSELQSIEAQLGHISINAVVSACRIGARGNGLEVIAGVIRELKMESASRSTDAGDALGLIASAIVSLTGNQVPEASDDSAAVLLGNLASRVSDLQKAGATGIEAAARVGTLAENLRASLVAARDHFEIGQLFAATVDRCCKALDEVASQAPPAPFSDGAAVEDMAADRYTMETERKVHRALANGEANLPFDEEPEILSDACEEEVEFF